MGRYAGLWPFVQCNHAAVVILIPEVILRTHFFYCPEELSGEKGRGRSSRRMTAPWVTVGDITIICYPSITKEPIKYKLITQGRHFKPGEKISTFQKLVGWLRYHRDHFLLRGGRELWWWGRSCFRDADVEGFHDFLCLLDVLHQVLHLSSSFTSFLVCVSYVPRKIKR
jgi:hypothetical protein